MNRSERQFGPELEPVWFNQISTKVHRDTESIFVNIHYNFIAR